MQTNTKAMPETKAAASTSSLGVHDIIAIVFKHKWKILLCSIAGIGAAVGVYISAVPMYESEAKVLVRYVVDRSSIDSVDGGGGSHRIGDAVINSEAEILTSMDIALHVAEDIGPERLVPPGKAPATTLTAAQVIASGLFVGARSNVIRISFRNRDPQVATLVLNKLVTEYFSKHLEAHRPTATTAFVTQQSDEVKQRLNRTEEELKKSKSKANVISRAESGAALSAELASSVRELNAAEADLAGLTVRVRELEKALATAPAGAKEEDEKAVSPAPLPPTDEQVQRYQSLVLRLSQLRQAEFELLSKYTPENQLVKLCQGEIAEITRQRTTLEKAHPGIDAIAPVVTDPSAATNTNRKPDIVLEKIFLAGAAAKVEALKARVKEVEGKIAHFSESSLEIEQLERRKELEETNYKYIGASLEKARIDGLLDPSKMPNLSIVQSPSQAVLATTDRDKTIFKLAGGGVALGLALAFLLELILDRSIKRPLELEAKTRVPLMLTIPDLSKSVGKRLRAEKASRALVKKGVPVEGLPWESGHFIRPFTEAIRDRLVLFFKLNDMTHKPKMIAVTGFSGGEGASTIAGGLAAVLSEMGDGKVLLVDMNGGEATVHPFFDGNPVRSVSEVLQGGASAPASAENLVLATASVPNGGGTHMVPKKFYNMVPHFKASDFDYIIFDMPPLDKSSATLAMAGSMDKVLVIVEAEKSNSDTVQRACGELTAARANVSAILNKTRSYLPKCLQG